MTHDDRPTTPVLPAAIKRAREAAALIPWTRQCLIDREIDPRAYDVIMLALDELAVAAVTSPRDDDESKHPRRVFRTAPVGLNLAAAERIPSDPVMIPIVRSVMVDLAKLEDAANELDLGGAHADHSLAIRTAMREITQLRERVAEAIADEKRDLDRFTDIARSAAIAGAELGQLRRVRGLAAALVSELEGRHEAPTHFNVWFGLKDALAGLGDIPPLDRGPVIHAASAFRPAPACDVDGMRPGDGLASRSNLEIVDCQACKDAIALAEAMRGTADVD